MLLVSLSIALFASNGSVIGPELDGHTPIEAVFERIADLAGEDPAEGLEQAEEQLRTLQSTLWL